MQISNRFKVKVVLRITDKFLKALGQPTCIVALLEKVA